MRKSTTSKFFCVVIIAVIISCSGFRNKPESKEMNKSATIDDKTVKEWSKSYRNWHYYPELVIPSNPDIKSFEEVKMTDVPTVFQLPGDKKWYMTFIGYDGKGYQSFIAESDDLIHWGNMRLAMGYGKEGEFDFGGRVLGAYLFEDYDVKSPRILKKKDGKFWSLYGAYAKQGGYEIDPGYEGLASSDNGIEWQRAKEKYILSIHEPEVAEWEKDCIYQPFLLEHEGLFYNFYNAKKMPEWIEQMGVATSTDLFNWKRYPENPVLRVRKGGFDAKFAADGKVFYDGDHWVMFYFGVGKGRKGGAHIMVAYSRDLYHYHWVADPEPLYKAGGNPSGLDKKYAHKISLVWNPENETYYMFYCAVDKDDNRGIGLITSKPIH